VERLCGFPLARAEIGVLEFGRAYDRYEFSPILRLEMAETARNQLWSIQNVVISSSYQAADMNAFLQVRLSGFWELAWLALGLES
jgi:hypothetical protein